MLAISHSRGLNMLVEIKPKEEFLANYPYLKGSIDAEIARREYTECIADNARRIIDEFGRPELMIEDRTDRVNAVTSFKVNLSESWKVSLTAITERHDDDYDTVFLALREYIEDVPNVKVLAKIHLNKGRVTDSDDKDLPFNELRNVYFTLEQLLADAEQASKLTNSFVNP